ncbi:MAG: DNA uptake lipoprotein ComL [Pseudolabrys sp.]|jgi:outer membrane protein assembly factor BamD|nr:DNA uptake lipoprotein ComL [Pseudolabrys sp.]
MAVVGVDLVRKWRAGARVVMTVVLLGAAVGGCSDFKLFGKDKPVPDQPADKLYNEGLYLLNVKNRPADAAKKFEDVDQEAPYSEWARKGLIMAAYSYYTAGKYADCITTAQRYIALHPGSPDASYAQYLIASSYYDQIPDVTRDQGDTDKALAALQDIINKYPGTEYANAAKQKIEVARDQLAGKEMMIGRYYLKKKDYVGAINRFKVVVTKYQTTREVEEALERLTEAYMALGIVGEAQTAAAVLGHNFPDSTWYKDAYRLVKSGGKEPAEDSNSWISKAFKGIGLS